jgi:hypothetical protein
MPPYAVQRSSAGSDFKPFFGRFANLANVAREQPVALTIMLQLWLVAHLHDRRA